MMKRLNKKGFTLMEMLIVVAIIAVLVAIAIPTFNSSLQTARENTDAANLRAAKAVGAVEYLTATPAPTAKVTYYFDAASGELKDATTGITGYGKATANEGKIITVTIDTDGTVTAEWPK